MGLRAFWHRHPWWCWPIASVVLVLTLLSSAAVIVHLRGMARLREVVASMRAQGLGVEPRDLVAALPDLDRDLQDRLWKELDTTWPGWDATAANERLLRPLRLGAGWNPDEADRAFLQRTAGTAERLRALLRDPRAVTSACGWIGGDLERGVRPGYHSAGLLPTRCLAEWLILADDCGDARAREDLSCLARSLERGASLIDLMILASVEQEIDRAVVAAAVRGVLDQAAFDAWRVEPTCDQAAVRRAVDVSRQIYAGDAARRALEGRGFPADVDIDQAHDILGIAAWIHGPDDVADEILVEAAYAGGQPSPPLRRRWEWWTVRSGLQPDHFVDSLQPFTRFVPDHVLRHRLAIAGVRILLASRGSLPADSEALGSTHDEPIVYRRLGERCFAVVDSESLTAVEEARLRDPKKWGMPIALDSHYLRIDVEPWAPPAKP
jgi:hypothetical protein